MRFSLVFVPESQAQLDALERDGSKKKVLKAVLKTLGLLETNLRHPGLQTHEYTSKKGPNGEKVFEAYAEQSTPNAWRVFFCYGPDQGELTVLSIEAHP